MNLKIIKLSKFTKSVKKLAKKYKNLANDLTTLNKELNKPNNNSIKISENIYKIRLQNSSNIQGKSGGFRVIYFLKIDKNTIYLLDIFSKSEVENIEKHKIIEIVKNYGL
jgi:mRNA-degrading endonuclease RelE of RelBE toxin-antitoxin system